MAGIDMEKEIVEYHKMEKLLESVMVQLSQAKAQKSELERALEAVEKSEDAVYKAVGGLFIKVKKDEAVDDLKHTLELLDVRIKSLENQRDSLTNKFERIRKDLEEKLGAGRSGPGGVA